MKILKFIFSFSLFLGLLQGANLNEIKERGFIKIGVFSDKPPFGFIDQNGKNQGFDIELAKEISKELFKDENKIEFLLVEAASRVEFLQADKVDLILANFTKTKERQRVVDFAKPYMKVSLGVVSKNGEISDLNQLKNKTLIVNKGTTADIYFTKNHPEIKLLKFDQNTETFAALLDARGDALAHDNTMLFGWAKNNPNFLVAIPNLGGVDEIAPAVKKGNKDLVKFLDDLIEKLTKEKFFYKAYEKTLKNSFGDKIEPQNVIY